MSKIAAVFATLTLVVVMLPFFAVPGSGGVDLAAPYACGQVGVILSTIRTLESAGRYNTRAGGSSASGAYQYIDTTWRYWAGQVGGDVTRYPSAYLAPTDLQDRAAAANVNTILNDHHGDVAAVPLVWYLPAALDNASLLDVVPSPETGNTLTPRQYQTAWMSLYQTTLAHAATAQVASCSGTITADGNWALPAPRETLTAAGLAAPHHDYPAVDLIMPEGTPVYAVTGGTVTRETHFNSNWYTAGCNGATPPSGCATCGNGITIASDNGLRTTYCHTSILYVNEGDRIVPGQHLADSGNTGRSGAPHLHVEIRINEIQHCPQQLIGAIYTNQPVPNPASLPTTGCYFQN